MSKRKNESLIPIEQINLILEKLNRPDLQDTLRQDLGDLKNSIKNIEKLFNELEDNIDLKTEVYGRLLQIRNKISSKQRGAKTMARMSRDRFGKITDHQSDERSVILLSIYESLNDVIISIESKQVADTPE